MHRSRLGLLVLLTLALALPSTRTASASTTLVAFTRQFNIFLMNSDGTAPSAITSRGTGYQGTWYPWYQWSYDGKYLVVVRDEPGPKRSRVRHLLVLNSAGKLVRDLGTIPEESDFYPTWALDSDQIAYVAVARPGQISSYTVDAVDIQGNKRLLWTYRTGPEGCGGGTPDPAQAAWNLETGYGGMPPSLQWSTVRHLAIYSSSCAGGLDLTNTGTHATRALGLPGRPWNEAAISRSGRLAVVQQCIRVVCPKSIVIVSLRSGAVAGTITNAELPTWSADGQFVYFVRRLPGRTLFLRDQYGNRIGFQTETSEIWRANNNGTHPLKLLSEDAYGFGSLYLTPDGQSLIFSRVDNDWGIWQHRLAGNRFTAALETKYGPKTQVQRFDSGHLPVAIAANAGRPAVEP